jgi:GNAT superfamily N-acetyltransferase
MMQILSSNSLSPNLLIQLREWFESEWGDFDSFEGNHPGIEIPSPMLAIDDQTSLLGGLAFSTFAEPDSDSIGVWINMLLVLPSERKKGIASLLVQSAESEAKRMGIRELFVLSEFPDLYQKLAWQFIGLDSSENETILKKAI